MWRFESSSDRIKISADLCWWQSGTINFKFNPILGKILPIWSKCNFPLFCIGHSQSKETWKILIIFWWENILIGNNLQIFARVSTLARWYRHMSRFIVKAKKNSFRWHLARLEQKIKMLHVLATGQILSQWGKLPAKWRTATKVWDLEPEGVTATLTQVLRHTLVKCLQKTRRII